MKKKHWTLAAQLFCWYAISLIIGFTTKYALSELKISSITAHAASQLLSIATIMAIFRPQALSKEIFTPDASIVIIALLTIADMCSIFYAIQNLTFILVIVIRALNIMVTYFINVCIQKEEFREDLIIILSWICGTIWCAFSGYEIKSTSLTPLFVLIGSTVLCSMKWTISAHILQANQQTPSQTQQQVTTIGALCLLPIALLSNSKLVTPSIHKNAHGKEFKLYAISLLVLSTMSTIQMQLDYIICKKTSAVNLTVLNAGKQVCSIFMSYLAFSEYLDGYQIFCLCCTAMGIIAYTIVRGNADHALAASTQMSMVLKDHSRSKTLAREARFAQLSVI